MTDEILGSVLLVRWRSGALKTPEAVIAQTNALGYGLTLGLQTRIDSRAHALADAVPHKKNSVDKRGFAEPSKGKTCVKKGLNRPGFRRGSLG